MNDRYIEKIIDEIDELLVENGIYAPAGIFRDLVWKIIQDTEQAYIDDAEIEKPMNDKLKQEAENKFDEIIIEKFTSGRNWTPYNFVKPYFIEGVEWGYNKAKAQSELDKDELVDEIDLSEVEFTDSIARQLKEDYKPDKGVKDERLV